MNEAGHRGALEQLRRARAKLDPVEDIRAYAELSHGMAAHALSAGILRRHGIDLDNHQGMTRWLQQHGYPDVADASGKWKAFASVDGTADKEMAIRHTNWTSFSRRLKRGPWPEATTTRLMDGLDALARRLRDIDDVVGVILFGSYARGEFGRKSDVDLLVLADPDDDATIKHARDAIVRATIETEAAFHLPMHLAPLIANVRQPGELGPELLHAIWSDGVVLFAEAPALATLQPEGLAPWTAVRFSTADLPRADAVRLSRRLHGRDGQPGLVHLPAVELARGALLLPARQAQVVRDALDEVGATYDAIPVWRQT